MIKSICKLGNLKLYARHNDVQRKTHKLKYLFWECTLNCNFYCKHCGSNAGNKTRNNELSTEEIKKAFGEIAINFNSKDIMVAVTGGEPLLRRDLFDVGKYINNLGFSWGIATNGYLINEEVVQKMKIAGMRTIAISIDGAGETHDHFRGVNGSYKQAMTAIKLLAEKNFLKDLQIATTVHRENYHQLDLMYDTFRATGIKSWKIVNVDPVGRAEHNKNIMLSKEQLAKMFDFIKECRKKDKELNITYACPGFLGLKYEKEVRGCYFRCDAGINTGSILYNGDIFVCPDVPRYPHLIQGNIKKDCFSAIWNNKFKYFRDKNRLNCRKCSMCDWWDECRGGAVHLWDFDRGQPKICHLEIINGA